MLKGTIGEPEIHYDTIIPVVLRFDIDLGFAQRQ